MVKAKTNEGLVSREEIETAAKILKKGGVVIFPTDTVYGIGAKFDDKVAVGRIRKIKGTPKSQKMPVLIDEVSYLKKLECEVGKEAKKLIEKYWPGALTLVFNSEIGKVGLRIPNHPITLSLIDEAGFPIIGTSANFHGEPVAKNFNQIDKKFLEKVDYVLKGECTIGAESTVVDVTGKTPKILREGAIRLS